MGKVVDLDVRIDLKNKIDPFTKIMSAVKSLEQEDTLVLHAPFNPLPLLKVMSKKGYSHESEEIEAKHWMVTFKKEVIENDA